MVHITTNIKTSRSLSEFKRKIKKRDGNSCVYRLCKIFVKHLGFYGYLLTSYLLSIVIRLCWCQLAFSYFVCLPTVEKLTIIIFLKLHDNNITKSTILHLTI